MVPLVLVVHAFGGSPEKFWYRWLASELGDRAEVEVLRMTEPRTPTIENWCGDLERRIAQCTGDGQPRELYLIGHSVGCQTIVRLLATSRCAELLAPSRVRLCGCLCVAAWFEVDNPWETIEPWCRAPIDCGSARREVDKAGCSLVVLLSDNDKYTPDFAANAKAWSDQLGADVRVIPDRSHFGGKRQPEILGAALDMLQGAASNVAAPSVLTLPEPSAAGVGKLPTELLALVLGHLDAYSLCSAEQVSVGWYIAARGDASTAGRGGWSVVLPRDYPAVPDAEQVKGATARLLYQLACLQRQCSRCHKRYHVGRNTAKACGFHPGVIISGHRDNGMRARWTCCGKWGPTRAGGNTELLRSESFCSFTRHLGSLSSLNTPEDIGDCGAAMEQGDAEDVPTQTRRLRTALGLESGRSLTSSTTEGVDGDGTRQDDPANRVHASLVEEMMHARSVAAAQSVSWLGCGE